MSAGSLTPRSWQPPMTQTLFIFSSQSANTASVIIHCSVDHNNANISFGTVSTILFRIDILNKIMNAVWECLGWHIFVLIRVETVTWLQDVRPACWECGGCGHPQHLTHFVLQKYLQWNYATKYIRHASKYNRSFWVSWLVGDFLYINATKYKTNIFSIYSTQ